MTLTRNVPLRRKRATKRRTRSPRCMVRRCGRPIKVVVGDAGAPAWINTPIGYCLSHAKQEADRRFSLAVRAVGRCEICGKTENLTCSHIFSRRYTATRYVRLNAECLCWGCHHQLTQRPLEAEERAKSLLGLTVWEELRWQALRGGTHTKIDYAEVLAGLT